tara:strand:- start:1966 stop:2754 length:789 start_codon:yes stop_codon:yes gene_type:complete
MRQYQNEVFPAHYVVYLVLIIGCCSFEYLSGGLVHNGMQALRKQVISRFDHVHKHYSSKAFQAKLLAALEASNNDLSLENHRLRQYIMDLESLKQENKQLKASIGHAHPDQHNIIARLERVYNYPSARLLYVRTPDHKAKPGMLVINNRGMLIGRVRAVTGQTAQVLLAQDKRSAIPVVVGKSKSSAIAVGVGAEIELIHIPIDAQVRKGDQVKVPSTTKEGLKYYAFGEVESVQATPDKTFLIAKIKHRDTLKDIEWLVLI